MDVSEIVDRESFEAWLEEQPEHLRDLYTRMTGVRTALRYFPYWVNAIAQITPSDGKAVTLPLTRRLLIAMVMGEPVDYKQFKDALNWTSQRTFDAFCAFEFTDTGAFCVGAMVSYLRADGGIASYFGDTFEHVRTDVDHLLGLSNLKDIYEHPVWRSQGPSENLKQAWETGRIWLETAPGYTFWLRWYEAILAGRPLTHDWDSHWQLMHDIALIPNEDWGEGTERDAIRVAKIIDLITQKHALQREVARAKQALENEVYNVMTLGRHRDNLPDDMPPSRILQYRAALAELQTELDAVELALQPPVPDAEALEEATGRLRAICEKIKKYPVAFAFVTLIGAAATGAAGQAGVRGMDWFFDQGMPQLIRGLKDVAPKPSAGPKPQQGWEKPSVDL